MIIKARNVYDGSQLLKNKYVYIKGDKIYNISNIKPNVKDEIIDVHTLTPAFIDAHSHIGMEREGEPYQEGETNEEMDSILVLGDALDAVYMDDKAFKNSIEEGVLYSCILPGSGNIIGGKSVVIRNFSNNVDNAFIKYDGMKMALGYNPRSTKDWKGTRPSTRMGVFSILRNEFLEVKKKKNKLTEKEKILKDIINGKIRLRIHVHREDDARRFLTFATNFNMKFTFEHLGDVYNIEFFKYLKQKHIPIVYGPLDSFAYKTELKHESKKNINLLLKSGVQFGLMSDHPVIEQSTLFYTLRHFLRFGLSKSDAIGILTKRNARILKLDKLGEIKKGYIASLLGWNGDPFDLSSQIKVILAEGKLIKS